MSKWQSEHQPEIVERVAAKTPFLHSTLGGAENSEEAESIRRR
jgi:hypothetical protein